MTAFVTNSNPVALNQFYDISRKDMHIKPEYSSFFIPMSSAMLGIKTTVNVIIATFMMTEILGIPISLSFLFMLIILTMELSLASPGSTGSWLIVFEAFSIPSSNVGLFSTYKLFTDNYATGVVEAYDIFEQYEAAYKMNALEAGRENI